jgi:hypothetical protein
MIVKHYKQVNRLCFIFSDDEDDDQDSVWFTLRPDGGLEITVCEKYEASELLSQTLPQEQVEALKKWLNGEPK